MSVAKQKGPKSIVLRPSGYQTIRSLIFDTKKSSRGVESSASRLASKCRGGAHAYLHLLHHLVKSDGAKKDRGDCGKKGL